MRFSGLIFLSSIFASSFAATEEGVAARDLQEGEPLKRVWVKYHKKSRSAMKTELKKRNSGLNMLFDFEDLDMYVVTVPESKLKSLKKNPAVQSVFEDVKRYPQHIPESVKRRKLQAGETMPYGIDLVQAPLLWDLGYKGQDITVCIVDTGVDETHEDFGSGQLSGSPNQESGTLIWGDDAVGHGTHCAGTVGAAQNGIGVVGVAPEANIISVKVFGDNGQFAYGSGILAAARECVDLGANIVSMSLGGPLPSLGELFGYRNLLRQNNVISVAAAGNFGNGLWSFPASYTGVVSVAAVDEAKELASFSQRNRQVDISGPGVDVLSTLPMNGPCQICDSVEEYEYGTISGTSMACPHVAGVLALLMSVNPEATGQELMDVLESGAMDLGDEGWDRQFGHGLAQAYDSALAMMGGSIKSAVIAAATKDDDSPCGEGMTSFDLKLLTDDHASETFWELRRMTDQGVELSGSGYSDNTAVKVSECIPKNCYTFTMYDSNGDGICCSRGEGAYTLTVGGDLLINNGGDFDLEDVMVFGSCVMDKSN